MFYDNKKVIKYADKVFLYKNFLSESEVKSINEKANALNKNDWEYENQEIDWYKDKTGPDMIELFPIWEKMSDFMYPEYVIHPMLSLLAVKPGDNGMFVHSDSPGRDMEEELTQEDRWQTCCIIDYGVIAYMGDFTGGEVFYPNLDHDGNPQEENYDNCLQVTVEPGDLVIHGSCHPYEHGVREVKSGIRYAFTNFMLQAKENPGTFNNYKTEEYYLKTKNINLEDLSNKWLTPIEWNPRFPQYIDKVVQ
jgi:hypothetical protein